MMGTSERPIDAVVTDHLNTFASGVARFNAILAQELGVPLLGLADPALDEAARPLLSFKPGELNVDEEMRVRAIVGRDGRPFEVYLHDWRDLPVEREMVRRAARVWSGNAEVEEHVDSLHPDVRAAWTPGLLRDHRRFQPAEISVFSFGMAHKIRTDMFQKLKALLDESGRSYRLYVSTANHETSSVREAELVYAQMHELFPKGLYFMGNLSDVAVYNYLQTTSFFAAFFAHGVRANNTSVAAAMEQGCVVVTNLDEYSPPHLEHMVNIIDIERCEELPEDPLTLRELGLNAMRVSRERSWERLACLLGDLE
jgi:hypothetical protein